MTPPKLTFRQGIREVMRSEMKADPRAIVLGEAVATWGGSAQVTTGLIEEFGSSRVIETPISENALVGQALGCALGGLSVFAEVYSADFLFCAGSEVLNDISKWRHQHRWEAPMHLVLRMPMASSGIAAGPEHTQCIEGYLHHVPGLVVVVPGSVKDAIGGLRASIRCGDPVVFLEHRRLYDLEEDLDPKIVAEHTSELGRTVHVKEGDDVTVVAWGWMRQITERAAVSLEQDGIALDIFDPLTIKPLDMDVIVRSATDTGRLLVVEEAPLTGSVGAEIIARAVEVSPHEIRQVGRVAMPDVPHPYHPRIEAEVVPDELRVVSKVKEMLAA